MNWEIGEPSLKQILDDSYGFIDTDRKIQAQQVCSVQDRVVSHQGLM